MILYADRITADLEFEEAARLRDELERLQGKPNRRHCEHSEAIQKVHPF